MLVDFYTDKKITSVPYQRDYDCWMSRLTEDEKQTIRQTLNSLIDGDEIHTAGWMPGRDWTGTPFQPIYEKATKRNIGLAAKCFGLVVWEVFMKRSEKWRTGRFEKNGEPIGSLTYFRVRQ
ncbi:MAG: hypothetical protein KGI29_00800 [Pseudomonadota bacterium]|nr:hypothetical protein [Pseudomonadota bacterium]MDE3038149.1 hypothetical protein [Pseudomonadota bacterium]